MNRRDISKLLSRIDEWHRGEANLGEIDWLLGIPAGTVSAIFFENELATVLGVHSDGHSPQECINCLLCFLTLRYALSIEGTRKL